jgi:hypothetical protein
LQVLHLQRCLGYHGGWERQELLLPDPLLLLLLLARLPLQATCQQRLLQQPQS